MTFLHVPDCLFYHLDQKYCLDPCQFIKYQSCKVSAGFRFCVCVLRVESHEVRGWTLNGSVDLPEYLSTAQRLHLTQIVTQIYKDFECTPLRDVTGTFFDILKAFDMFSDKDLFFKCQLYGAEGSLLRLMKISLTEHQQTVSLNIQISLQ